MAHTDSSGRSRLYRRSLKLALDWSVHRHLWRGQALYIRSLFEANSNVREPRQQRVSSLSPSSHALHLLWIPSILSPRLNHSPGNTTH
ncbi:unnamed protein product [Aureobasidium pullulans]|nr:unnamed protein product [Aureobasidium pullulans]